MSEEKMSFKEAIKKLDIEEYGERIFNSNSHGELIHLYDYILIAESFTDVSWFKDWFGKVVTFAENNWARPESIFQHILKLLKREINNQKEK